MAGTITVKLYNIDDDNEKVNKSLGTATEFTNCTMLETVDVTKPTVRITTSTNLSHFNYMYIERYGRYYYIERVETTPTGLWVLYTRCDVLMSYKSQILALRGTVTRSESLYNGYLNDSQYKALAYRKIVTKSFPSGVDNDCFILMTVG